MIVSTNTSAIIAHGELSKTEGKLADSLKKLSSGYKVNSSSDDSVAMAISEKMRMQIRALERGSQNAADGSSMVETAEGALNEINSMLQRIRELAVQGSNDTYGDDDRQSIVSEIDALKEEIDRISKDTEFNNNNILNGDIEKKAYSLDANENIVTGVTPIYTDFEVQLGDYPLNVSGDGTIDFQYDGAGDPIGFSGEATISVESSVDSTISYVTINDRDNYSVTLAVDTQKLSVAAGDNMNFNLSVKDMGSMLIQIGGKAGQSIDVYIPEVSIRTLGLSYVEFNTSDDCTKAIADVEKSISKISKIRAEIGALENRFTSSISSSEVTKESMENAQSRIIDVDMAEEMTAYTELNVLNQAGVSVLAQANQIPEKILQLLQ